MLKGDTTAEVVYVAFVSQCNNKQIKQPPHTCCNKTVDIITGTELKTCSNSFKVTLKILRKGRERDRYSMKDYWIKYNLKRKKYFNFAESVPGNSARAEAVIFWDRGSGWCQALCLHSNIRYCKKSPGRERWLIHRLVLIDNLNSMSAISWGR